jgi:hypothetical protein
MKESMWGYWFIVLGLSIMSIMVLLQNYTTTNEQDYYLIKNVLEASMYESVDYAYFRDTSRIRMNTEKFVENFLRRFAESVNINKTYEINFYQIYEDPPAASVEIKSDADGTKGKTEVDDVVTNRLTGILYTNQYYNKNVVVFNPED